MRTSSEVIRRSSIRLRLEKFRLFPDTKWFRLAPLTCLVGRNSSGKSSVISALLLLKQSLEGDLMGSSRVPLILTGPYCDLGNFGDVIYNHDESSDLHISVSSTYADLRYSTASTAGPLVHLLVPRMSPALRPYFIRWDEGKLPRKGRITTRMTFSKDEPFGPSLSRIEVVAENIGAARFVRTLTGERTQHWRVYTTDLPPKSVSLSSYYRSYFPVFETRQSDYKKADPGARRLIRQFTTVCNLQFDYLNRLLFRSEVIGPFRTPPERRYSFGGFASSRGDPSGEYATNLLITESLVSRQGNRPLRDAVSFWVKHLGLAETLDVKDIAKRLNLFEVDVTGAGRKGKANIADVGFGLSQVLPVIVQGLLMQPGGIYLVQQPELHLHPDAQAGLADFFIYLASYGVITVIETHSEYLLLRIRRRLAEGGAPLRLGLQNERLAVPPLSRHEVAILLTGSQGKAGPFISELQINGSFQFEHLPVGFMSQAMEDRLELLKLLGRSNA